MTGTLYLAKEDPANMKKMIAIEDLALDLGLPDEQVALWIKTERIDVHADYRGRPAVNADIKNTFSERSDYSLAIKKSISNDKHLKNISTIQAGKLQEKRFALIDKYQTFIKEIQNIHEAHMDAANQHDEESAIRAAYLLFTKAISCLKMGCDNLQSGYWFAGSVIREIDETIDLAQYFVITKDSEQGESDLKKWFRQNFAPKHSKCREALSNHMRALQDDIEKDNHRLLMNELYQKKSKWVHPTYGVIREVTEFDTDNRIKIKSMSYGITDHELKLYELTEFYKSSIWSVFQSFMICFSKDLPLNENTRSRLVEIDRFFQRWE